MNIDKNIVLTLVDDIMKDPKIFNHLKRPGPNPEFSDPEVITISLYQELIEENREVHFYRLHHKELKLSV